MNTRLSDKQSTPESLVNFRINISTESRKNNKNATTNNSPGRWIFSNKAVTVGKYKIEKGFFYLGRMLNSNDSYPTDSALIDPSLPIDDSSPDYDGNDMGYWPNYSTITPSSRAAYLEWLASNRDDPKAYIGYVFLYFYGLERRLLVDREKGLVHNKEIALLFREIKRLITVYGSNGSFRNYSVNLMSYIWILFGAKGKTPYELLFINGAPSPISPLRSGKKNRGRKKHPCQFSFCMAKKPF